MLNDLRLFILGRAQQSAGARAAHEWIVEPVNDQFVPDSRFHGIAFPIQKQRIRQCACLLILDPSFFAYDVIQYENKIIGRQFR
ncbi:MAG: hypothetical protein IIC26_01825 [Chloroflexi bacterium]|nr:hypothetical protein [Chloroflexota bacterium]